MRVFPFCNGSDLVILIGYSFHREIFLRKNAVSFAVIQSYHTENGSASDRQGMAVDKKKMLNKNEINIRYETSSPRSHVPSLSLSRIPCISNFIKCELCNNKKCCENASLCCPCTQYICGQPRTNYSLWSNVPTTCWIRASLRHACPQHM